MVKNALSLVAGGALVLSAAACGNAEASNARLALRAAAPSRDSLAADSIARARQDSINRTLPEYVVDSILPVEEMLRRFRMQIGGSQLASFESASPSRDALVRRFADALARSDSVALLQMAISPREFADLLYPESPNIRPPYRQDPALVWRTIQNPSVSGLKRLVRRAGGTPLQLAGYRCASSPVVEGKNRFWRECQVRVVSVASDTTMHRYFGTIVEREGRFKFLGYRNEF